MSEKKEYTAEEVARMIADRAAEVMKKNEISSEYIEEFLAKSKNSAHEIEPGQEPSSEGTEMQSSMESAESSEMEDEPLQGESKDKKEDEDDEEEDKKDEEDKYEFKKSESGMHTVQYKRLVKGVMATPEQMAELERLKADKENKTRMATPEEKKQLEEKKKKVKPSSDHMRPRGVEDLAASEEMDKCGDMVSTKKHESGMHTVEYQVLQKNYAKKIKEGKNIEISHSDEDGASKEMSDAAQAAHSIRGKSSLADQTKGKQIARDYKNKSREVDGKGKVYHEGEKKKISALDLPDRRKKKGTIEDRADKELGDIADKDSDVGRSKTRERGEGHIFDKKSKENKKSEMDKCGDMKVVKSEKLSNFLKKNTSNEQ